MKKQFIFLGVILICLSVLNPLPGIGNEANRPPLPLDMEMLKKALSYVRGNSKSDGSWPRTISYEHKVYDFRKDVFHLEKKTFSLKSKPIRIIPHPVGVAEILWAICPRERLIAFNEFSADPESCFIADQVKKKALYLNPNRLNWLSATGLISYSQYFIQGQRLKKSKNRQRYLTLIWAILDQLSR